MTEPFALEYCGVRMVIGGDDGQTLARLRQEFDAYVVLAAESRVGGDAAQITLAIHRRQPPYERVPPVEASLYSLGAICYRHRGRHYVDYGGRGLLIYDFAAETGELYSEDEELLFEKARLTLLSRMGERLDRRHIHRLHACALSKNGRAVVCILPMEGGKTTLAVGVLARDQDARFITDDVCYLNSRGEIFPFMGAVGVRDKSLIDGIPGEYIREVDRPYYGRKYMIDPAYFHQRLSGPSRIEAVLVGKRVFTPDSRIRPLAKIRALGPFIQAGVFGLGLPQIIELFLKGGFQDFWQKTAILFSRIWLFIRLILRAKVYEFRMGRDIDRSVGVFAGFIDMTCRPAGQKNRRACEPDVTGKN